jgi:hypothetical protein
MSIKENDPDTLQILDESDEKWVRHWRKTISKKSVHMKELTMFIPSKETVATVHLGIKTRT